MPLVHTVLKCYMAAMKEEEWMERVIDNAGASNAICSAFRCPDEACRELVLKMLSVFAFSAPVKGLPRVLAAWAAYHVQWKEPERYADLVQLLRAPSPGPDTLLARRASTAMHRCAPPRPHGVVLRLSTACPPPILCRLVYATVGSSVLTCRFHEPG